DGQGLANVVVRGTSAQGMTMRPQVRIVSGRLFRAGASEVVIGEGLTRGKLGLRIGDSLRFGLREWRVTGVFSAGGSGFDSEVWGSGEQIMQA
ncbi:ABC transporter permease, partial [Acinetobacter baumannii]